MTDVASLELCKELYELSGWGYNFHAYGDGKHDLTDRMWRHWEAKRTGSEWWSCLDNYDRMGDLRDPFDNRRPTGITHNVLDRVPAYTCGYLLRKLPARIDNPVKSGIDNPRTIALKLEHCMAGNGEYRADYHVQYNAPVAEAWGDTPEDALCKLAIELFKQGVIKQ